MRTQVILFRLGIVCIPLQVSGFYDEEVFTCDLFCPQAPCGQQVADSSRFPRGTSIHHKVS